MELGLGDTCFSTRVVKKAKHVAISKDACILLLLHNYKEKYVCWFIYRS
jgi:hypothetical protein